VLAAAVVEKVSGETLFEFLQQHVFAPLHMAPVTEYAPTAAAYTRHGLGPVVPAPKEGAGWLFGAANLAMQPSDLALWDVSLMNRSLLKAPSYDQAFEPVVLKSGHTADYALGFAVQKVDGRLRIGHAGAGSGFLAENRVWPKERPRS
jgi:CubicO group peptidase (beta-lactamase class C family)